MLRLNILQNQWLFLALAGGLGVLLMVVLGYVALWRRREEPPSVPGGPGSPSAGSAGYFPMVMIVLIVGLAIWGIVYTLMAVMNPPNW